ncbi:MAG TPA: hypothetical protein VL984_13115, partial [Acidimicrobiales bacterium]|nr:hypothetical protein [Acidimicrobiales bacterium]
MAPRSPNSATLRWGPHGGSGDTRGECAAAGAGAGARSGVPPAVQGRWEEASPSFDRTVPVPFAELPTAPAGVPLGSGDGEAPGPGNAPRRGRRLWWLVTVVGLVVAVVGAGTAVYFSTRPAGPSRSSPPPASQRLPPTGPPRRANKALPSAGALRAMAPAAAFKLLAGAVAAAQEATSGAASQACATQPPATARRQ